MAREGGGEEGIRKVPYDLRSKKRSNRAKKEADICVSINVHVQVWGGAVRWTP